MGAGHPFLSVQSTLRIASVASTQAETPSDRAPPHTSPACALTPSKHRPAAKENKSRTWRGSGRTVARSWHGLRRAHVQPPLKQNGDADGESRARRQRLRRAGGRPPRWPSPSSGSSPRAWTARCALAARH